MPFLKRILGEGRNFDSKSIAILTEAFDAVVAKLGLRSIEEREKGARIIIGLAVGQMDLDSAKLRDEAVALLTRDESPPGHSSSLLSSSLTE